jgi:hypothetical protein
VLPGRFSPPWFHSAARPTWRSTEENAMQRRPFLALFAIAGIVAFVGCGKSNHLAPQQAGFGRVNVALTDAPADVEHIYLDVREVWVHRLNDGTPGDGLTESDDPHHDDGDADSLNDDGDHDGDDDGDHDGDHESDDSGVWHRLATNVGIIDLLELRNGVFEGLATGRVPAGTYDQIRLKLADDNTIVVDGATHSLKVPSGETSGYKLMGTFHVPIEGVVDVGLDFDAERSVHVTGNGTWMLKPVVRIHEIVTTGRIHGRIDPASAVSKVYALQEPDTIATTQSGGDGQFLLSLLPPGDYLVRISPMVEGFRDTVVGPVHVEIGQTAELGTIALGGGPVTPTTGRLIGTVSPNSFATRVVLSQSGAPFDSVDTGSSGGFGFENLTPGTWDLDLRPSNPDYKTKHVGGLVITAGATTDAGTIVLEPQSTAGTGSVSGTVVPGDVSTWVVLIDVANAPLDSVVTTPGTGAFAFQQLAAGTYGLVLKPPATFETRFFGPFTVSAGANNDLGPIYLTPVATGAVLAPARIGAGR